MLRVLTPAALLLVLLFAPISAQSVSDWSTSGEAVSGLVLISGRDYVTSIRGCAMAGQGNSVFACVSGPEAWTMVVALGLILLAIVSGLLGLLPPLRRVFSLVGLGISAIVAADLCVYAIPLLLANAEATTTVGLSTWGVWLAFAGTGLAVANNWIGARQD